MAYALAGLALVSAYSQSEAIKLEGNYQKQIYQTNAQFADLQSKNAIQIGNQNAAAIQRKTKKIIGAQRAAAAAQGIEVNSGSPLALQAETDYLGELDAITAKNNAWQEALGYKAQSSNLMFQGNQAQAAAQHRARNTLLSGGLQAGSFSLAGYSSARGNS